MGSTVDNEFSITPEQNTALFTIIPQAIARCREYGDAINFRNVYNSLLVIDSAGAPAIPPIFTGSMFNDEQLYQFLLIHNEQFSIPLYSDAIMQVLDIEPGYHPTRTFIEAVGFIFFTRLPRTLALIQNARYRPTFFRIHNCERGLVALLEVDDQRFIVKSAAYHEDTELAQSLGAMELAPQVFEATPYELTEEFIEDPPILALTSKPKLVGDALGWIIHELHAQGVVYANNFSKHVLVGSRMLGRPRVRIIDLEFAYRGNDFSVDWEQAMRELVYLFPDEKQRQIAVERMECWRIEDK